MTQSLVVQGGGEGIGGRERERGGERGGRGGGGERGRGRDTHTDQERASIWMAGFWIPTSLGVRLTVFDETKQKRSQQRSDRSEARQRLSAVIAQTFAPVISPRIFIETSSTFTLVLFFGARPRADLRFCDVAAPGVVKSAIFLLGAGSACKTPRKAICRILADVHARFPQSLGSSASFSQRCSSWLGC